MSAFYRVAKDAAACYADHSDPLNMGGAQANLVSSPRPELQQFDSIEVRSRNWRSQIKSTGNHHW